MKVYFISFKRYETYCQQLGARVRSGLMRMRTVGSSRALAPAGLDATVPAAVLGTGSLVVRGVSATVRVTWGIR
jgi:hypothetical protein